MQIIQTSIFHSATSDACLKRLWNCQQHIFLFHSTYSGRGEDGAGQKCDKFFCCFAVWLDAMEENGKFGQLGATFKKIQILPNL